MNEFWTIEISLQDLYVFQITCKNSPGSETIFINWKQSVANVTVNCLRFLIHSIIQIRASIFDWSGDWLAIVYLTAIKPSNPPMWPALSLKCYLIFSWFIRKTLSTRCRRHYCCWLQPSLINSMCKWNMYLSPNY